MTVTIEIPTKRVLVVSDNSRLLEVTLESLREASSYFDIDVTARYSSINKNSDQLSNLGAKAINLKDKSQVDWVINNFDLILSIHCKQIFPTELVSKVESINFHPGLNPYNRGWFPQVFSIINGLPTGVTVHLMDAEIDHGAIISQQVVPIECWETSLEVYEKVINTEVEVIHKLIPIILEGNFRRVFPVDEGNYNSIEDFRKLCELDLNQIGTLGDHINMLRALTHGDFQNAYFVLENGEKISVKVSLSKIDAPH